MLQGTQRGTFVHEVELRNPTESRTTSYERQASYSTVATVWARIEYRRGDKGDFEGTPRGSDTWQAFVRADPAFGALLSLRSQIRRVSDQRVWNVIGITDVDARGYEFVLDIEEYVN